MNNVQLSITIGLIGLLLLINQLAGGDYRCAHCPGGLPWYGWGSGFAVLFIAGLAYARQRGERAHRLLDQPAPAQPVTQEIDEKWNENLRRKYDWDGPDYPHPVIVAERCIGCHACVESCPHDVLTISYTEKHQPVASVSDHELCMEDTACEAACPVSPKACVVVNTAMQIRSLPAPWRDHKYMSSESGCYIIGDVSGTPLIKNAVNEGATVMIHLANELRADGGNDSLPPVDYEVAIIGAGPAGLSAAVMSKKLGLNYICIERDTVMSTLVNFYPEGKYVYFKPETIEWTGSIHLPGLEEYVEEVLEEFLDGSRKAQVGELLAAEREAAEREEAGQKDTLDPMVKQILKDARNKYKALLEGIPECVAEVLEEILDESDRERIKVLFAAKRASTLDEVAKQTLEATRAHYRALAKADADGTISETERAHLAHARRKYDGLLARLASARRKFEALLAAEEKYYLVELLKEEQELKNKDEELVPAKKNRLDLARRAYGDQLEAELTAGKLSEKRFQALARARCKVAGDQREVLLNTWRMNAKENDVRVNEKESCTGVKRAEDGDYFIVRTKKEEAQGAGEDKEKGEEENSYRARRVVLAIGNSSSPMKLKVKNEDIKVRRGGEESDKVLYRLSHPMAYTNLHLIVVGGGNSAVEAAVALVTLRRDDEICFRPDNQQNKVTLLVRTSDLKTDVKFGNKQQLYQCIERGLITLRLNTQIKEIHDNEVVTTNLVTGKEDSIKPNDFIFALIGSERPAALLNQIKVKIVK